MGDHGGPFALTQKWLLLFVVVFSSPPHTKQPNNWHADFAALNNVALCGRCCEIFLIELWRASKEECSPKLAYELLL